MSPILHLDTDEAEKACKTMVSFRNTTSETITKLLDDTDSFLYQGGWVGPARDEFVELWEEWSKKEGDAWGTLGAAYAVLGNLVQLWTEASTKFGPS